MEKKIEAREERADGRSSGDENESRAKARERERDVTVTAAAAITLNTKSRRQRQKQRGREGSQPKLNDHNALALRGHALCHLEVTWPSNEREGKRIVVFSLLN